MSSAYDDGHAAGLKCAAERTGAECQGLADRYAVAFAPGLQEKLQDAAYCEAYYAGFFQALGLVPNRDARK